MESGEIQRQANNETTLPVVSLIHELSVEWLLC